MEFVSPNRSFFEINVGGSWFSTISSITASLSFRNTSPALKSSSLTSSFLGDFQGSNAEESEARNIVKAIEENEERRKLLLAAAKKNSHAGEMFRSTKRKLADYQSTESLGGRDSTVLLENESSFLRKDVNRKRRKGDVGSIFDIISKKIMTVHHKLLL